MGINIPGVINNPNIVIELTDALLRGTTDIRGALKVNEVAMTATPADINLVAGLAAGAITTGLVKYWQTEITCANGTAVVVPLISIPVNSIILDVITICTQAFNGNATKTFEVGIDGNTDKWVDPVDCPVTLAGKINLVAGTNNDQKLPEIIVAAAAGVMQAVYTNTAAATTGKMLVKVVYC